LYDFFSPSPPEHPKIAKTDIHRRTFFMKH